MPRTVLAALALSLVLVVGSPAAASAAPPVASGYWAGFVDYWEGMVKKQNSIVLMVLGVGAVGIFIITRGKWKK